MTARWSTLWWDNYTAAPIIAVTDAEVCPHMPLLPPLFVAAAGDGGAGASGAPRRLRFAAFADGDAWGGDAHALGHATTLDAMWPSRFPMFFWREDFGALRRHLAARFGQ